MSQPQKELAIKRQANMMPIEKAWKNVQRQKDGFVEVLDVFVEVLDVGRCRNAVKKHCPCGWAKCVWRANYSCTNELTKCCPVNYDLKCCESEKDFIVEVLVMRKCRKTVNKHCLCGWAKCVRREGYSCTNELTKCCAVNTFYSSSGTFNDMIRAEHC
uniref:GRANULINS domain-containing protein n=1 Tax=Globodera pallida TaxID=36090 RepID=A0A183BU47_GLOPA